MSVGRLFWIVGACLAVAAIVYTGIWHLFTVFIWANPMLTWLPVLAVVVVGFLAGGLRALVSSRGASPGAPPAPPSTMIPGVQLEGQATPAVARAAPAPAVTPSRASIFNWGWGLLAGIVVLVMGLWFTLIQPRHGGLDDVNYTVVDELPQQSQVRLLPRTGITDDQNFREAKEIHLVRDPITGKLQWTGEWQSSWFGAPSVGVSEKPLDDVVSRSDIVRTGFKNSVAGVAPDTFKNTADRKHPLSKIQYPVLVPNGKDEAFAVSPYMGYHGFPFREPYLKGVLVYHQDGTIEDLTPEEAQARPELVRSGRIVPEAVARSEAEALADSDEFEGRIDDADDNKQPFLTAIDRDTTVWLTIINANEGDAVKALVLTDSSTDETDVWAPDADHPLISTQDVIAQARSLPLQWEEERCCDSDGDSYTVTLREVVEPRLAFKDGKPYYLVTVVPTDDLFLPRDVEYTLLIDAQTGKRISKFDHVNGGAAEDARLQAFFQN